MKLSEEIRNTNFNLNDWYDHVERLIDISKMKDEDKGFIKGCMETYSEMGFTTEQVYYELISDCKAIGE